MSLSIITNAAKVAVDLEKRRLRMQAETLALTANISAGRIQRRSRLKAAIQIQARGGLINKRIRFFKWGQAKRKSPSATVVYYTRPIWAHDSFAGSALAPHAFIATMPLNNAQQLTGHRGAFERRSAARFSRGRDKNDVLRRKRLPIQKVTLPTLRVMTKIISEEKRILGKTWPKTYKRARSRIRLG